MALPKSATVIVPLPSTTDRHGTPRRHADTPNPPDGPNGNKIALFNHIFNIAGFVPATYGILGYA